MIKKISCPPLLLLFSCALAACSLQAMAQTGTKKRASSFYTIDDFSRVKKIDTHEHITEEIDTAFIGQAAKDNFQLLTINVYTADGMPLEQQQDFALQQIHDYPGRIAYATAFSLEHFNEDGWTQEVIAYLKNSFAKGAVAVKVWKNVGMQLRDKDSNLVFIDNPRFDSVLDFLAKNHIPLIGHLGEHRNSWLPLDKMTVKGNRDYARAHPAEHMYLHPERPSYWEYIRVRDHMLEKHPDLVFIGAHLASLEWSVDELAKRFDKFPNMAVDMAERISHLQYQCLTQWQKVHDFFIKYQDRILYGTDLRYDAMDIVNKHITDAAGLKMHAHEIWLRHWRFFTSTDTMQVPKVEGKFKGLGLPKEVIDKIYYKNAVKWIPGIVKP